VSDDQEEEMLYIPSVVEQTPRGERSWDLFSRLRQNRLVFIGGEINDTVASLVIAQLFYLQNEDPDKRIELYINTVGGEVPAGLAIYDTMQLIRPEIHTFCVGKSVSMGAVLLAAGTKGKRSALPNSRVMIHQPLGGTYGQVSDVDIFTKELVRTRDRINEIMAYHTGQDVETIKRDTERDRWMTAEEAKEYGIVDEVLTMPSAAKTEAKDDDSESGS
jgi:ATP-dependent Clp protease protease subunit